MSIRMIQLIVLIIVTLILSACGTTYSPKVLNLAKTIDFYQMDNPQWCGPEEKCEYVGELQCDIEGRKEKGAIKKCEKKLRAEAVSHGADTVVAHPDHWFTDYTAGFNDKDNYYRIYAQIYNCSNKASDLLNELPQSKRSSLKSQVKLYSSDYVKKCSVENRCKNLGKTTCGTVQGMPFSRCVKKLNRDLSRSTGEKYNALLIKSDRIMAVLGTYRLYIDKLQCE